jgi:hypothetical protein
MNHGNWYWIGYIICWVLTFFGCWIYCIASYGFLLGLGLGWLPSGIAATVVSLLWPLLLLAVVVIAWVLFRH